MAYGNNRAAQQPRATFQTAGGVTMKFYHPYLIGAVDTGPGGSGSVILGEIDCSKACKLNQLFLDAEPAQDSAFQEVLVDGSIITITNSLLAGVMNLALVKTTGLVATGDLIAALHLIVASKDAVGGSFKRVQEIDGMIHTRLYYGVSVKRVPHDKIAGNSVPDWNTQLNYAGFIDAVSASSADNEKQIWAVGSAAGISGIFNPYAVQNGSTGTDPMSASNVPNMGTDVADDTSEASNREVATEFSEIATSYSELVENASEILPTTP